MIVFRPAVLAIACFAPVAHAQSAPSTADSPAPNTYAAELVDTVHRVGQWFKMDWSTGWDPGSTWRVMASPETYHFSYNPDHRHVYMLGLQRQRSDGFLVGGTLFRNSFGQPSTYVFIGQRFDHVAKLEPMFIELTGGVLYGYRGEYADKVPFNHHGFSPAIVPSLGWQFTPMFSAQVNVLGNSALMFQVSADFK